MDLELSETTIENLANELWGRIVGAHCDPIEFNLRAKLALEQRILGTTGKPFGLDKLSAAEAAVYIGVRTETLQDKHKRRLLGVSEPYSFGGKTILASIRA